MKSIYKKVKYSHFYNNPNTFVSIFDEKSKKELIPKRKEFYNKEGEHLTFNLNVRKIYEVYHGNKFSYLIGHALSNASGIDPNKAIYWTVFSKRENENWKYQHRGGTREIKDLKKYNENILSQL